MQKQKIMKPKYYHRLHFLVLCIFTYPVLGQVHFEANAGITTEISNDIRIETDGNWVHEGNLVPGTSTVKFYGVTYQ